MDLKKLRAAIERALLRLGVSENMCIYLAATSFADQADEWARIADRATRGEVAKVYLFATHHDGNRLTTFVYAPDQEDHMAEVVKLLGTRHSWGYVDSPEGMQPAQEDAYPVVVYEIGREVRTAEPAA